jgi:hypothetical protein
MQRKRKDDPSRPNSWKSSPGARDVYTVRGADGSPRGFRVQMTMSGRVYRWLQVFPLKDIDGANAAAAILRRRIGLT